MCDEPFGLATDLQNDVLHSFVKNNWSSIAHLAPPYCLPYPFNSKSCMFSFLLNIPWFSFE